MSAILWRKSWQHLFSSTASGDGGDVLPVLIACASEHRKPAFDACAWIMDEIKLVAPLWKKEHLVEGESRWVGYDRHERNTTTPEYS